MTAEQGTPQAEEEARQEEIAAVLALLLTPGGGSVRLRRLRAMARRQGMGLARVLGMTERETAHLCAGAGDLAHWASQCGEEQQSRARRLIRTGLMRGCFVLEEDPEYPDALASLLGARAPVLLHARGNLELLAEAGAAVVGAREATPDGLAAARECACVIAGEGAVVVSGAAAGVDSAAHFTALKGGGRTLAVLPQGLATYSTPDVFEQPMLEGRLLLLSPYAPDAPWSSANAVQRNDLISALSEIACVIEPRKVGGSIRTARSSLAYGRPTLVLPHQDGCAAEALRQRGAVLLDGEAGEARQIQVRDAWRGRQLKAHAGQQELF